MKKRIFGGDLKEITSQSDNFYYNLTIKNDTNQIKNCTYNETRVSPILENPSEYFLSIVRFLIPGNLIPIFYFPDPAGVRKFFITFESNLGLIASTQVFYTNSSSVDPNRPVSSYQQFLNDINTTIFNCAVAYFAAGGPIPDPGLAPTTVPHFIYNPNTQLFSLIGDGTLYYPSVNGAVPYTKIWLNYNLYNYFNSFDGFTRGFDLPDNRDFNIYVQDNGNNVGAIGPDLEIIQETNTQYLWNDLSRIIFVTSSLPVRKEYQASEEGKNVVISMLTDFEITQDGTSRTNDCYQYFPQGPYRLIDLLSNEPLKKFDVSIFWETKFGDIFPIQLGPNQIATVKFLFSKRREF